MTMATVTPNPGIDFIQDEILLNFPETLTPEVKAQLTASRGSLQAFFSWAAATTTTLVNKKIAAGEIQEDDMIGLSTYRAKVMSSIFRTRSPWLSIHLTSSLHDTITTKRSDFKAETLVARAKQLSPSPPESAKVTEFAKSYGERVAKGSQAYEALDAHFWSLIPVFQYDRMVEEVKASMQVFEIVLKTTHQHPEPAGSTTAKGFFDKKPAGGADKIVIDPLFAATQYGFNSDIFDKGNSS